MSKRLILVLALAFVVGVTFAAYAGVQNVKVSGDITASGVLRDHFNLQQGYSIPGVPLFDGKSDLHQSFFMTQTRIRLDADLTDNVSATVRLINERVWGSKNSGSTVTTLGNGQYTDLVGGVDNGDSIDLDLAYITLKEFLYSPLTLTVGRQEVKFGNGLIIGNANVGFNILPVSQVPRDLSERKAFDAIRATLNYDPLVVDLMYSKIKQQTTFVNNIADLFGINATYALGKKVDLSAYYFLKRDNYERNFDSKQNADMVSTVGGLVAVRPVKDLVTSFEAAYQFGNNDHTETLFGAPVTSTSDARRHDAWAIQAMSDYTFSKVKMTPKIGISYTYLSGGQSEENGMNKGWDPMFYDQKLNNITYALLPFTNLSVVNLKGSFKPMEDVTLGINYGYYDTASRASGAILATPGTLDAGINDSIGFYYTGKRHLGDAIDATITYDYTEDVQLGLTAGWFKSGAGLANSEITGNSRCDASQVIGSMKVTF